MTTMTLSQQIITIAVIVAGTMITRFLPFILFPAGKKTPEYVQYLGRVLVAALHLWKRQMLISIAGGTVCYMLLVQLVF